MRLDIKPLTVNQVWQGKRFKTPRYKKYERDVLMILPKLTIPEGRLIVMIRVGFSNDMADLDNIAKPFIDILQKKYKFNDNKIYKLILEKEIVKKGDEYIDFCICGL